MDWPCGDIGMPRALTAAMRDRSLDRLGTYGGAALLFMLAGCGSSEDGATRDVASNPAYGESATEGDEAGTLPGPSAAPGLPSGGTLDSIASPRPSGTSADTPAAPAGVAPSAVPPPQVGPGTARVAPGTLTAGAWDDSRNLERFLAYRAELFSAQTPGLLSFDEADHRAAALEGQQPKPHATLDVALVIDTTGSMGDELQYIQSEFDALSAAIEGQYPDAEQRWALVLYRDVGDEYVARSIDFQAAGEGFRMLLAEQSAGGGGDYPEASDAALEAMNQLRWRSDEATARLAFWVGDAPHHTDRAAALSAAIEVAHTQGVHLYPVASSGVDELTELSMRSAAQLTLARYVFLTDDSGVGGEHKEPSIPCYFVTRLNDAILRMVDIEMSGTYREPEADQVIRTGGSPTEGACKLESGQTVFAF